MTTNSSSDHGSATVLYPNSHEDSQHVEIHINRGFSDAITATTTAADDDNSRRSSSNETSKRSINFSTSGANSANKRISANSWRDSYNVNNSNNNNRYSNTSSTKTEISSSKKDLKQLRKPSDRIQSKSLCATFFYNIPRSSFMITIPGFIILVTGAILTATTDRDVSWVDGGVLLVALVCLILGGVWTLAGLIYWFVTWCRYKPDKLKRSQFRQPGVVSYTTSTSADAAPISNSNPSRPVSGATASTATPPSSGSSTFDALSSPFVLQPHPIFSQQQLQLSQQLKIQQNPVDQQLVVQHQQQQPQQQETALQKDLNAIERVPEQEYRKNLQQTAQLTSATIEDEIQQNVNRNSK